MSQALVAARPAGAVKRRAGPLGWSPRVWRKFRNGLLFTSPWLVGTVVFTIYPIFASLYYSFTEYSVVTRPQWIGLQNFEYMLLKDDRFWTAMKNTLIFAGMSVPLGLILSITVAILLNMRLRGMSIYRAAIYMPCVMPAVAYSVVWLWLMDPQYGIANDILRGLGIPPIGWFMDPKWSKPSLVFIGLWGVGGAVVIFLAGLQDVPESLHEAAELDGAGTLKRFRHVTLPMLTPTIFFNLVMSLIGAFSLFTSVFVITRGHGGPADSTLVYSLLLYINAFSYFRMGYASAMAWILFMIVSAATLIVFKTSGRWVYYGGGGAG
jgi:multiple sugar transport system permease protein